MSSVPSSTLVEHSIWWHVYPLGACGAPIRPGDDRAPGDWPLEHRLPHLEAWLDHVIELGCSGLLLGPVFASVAHGYDTLDHFRIDPRLGDDSDWDHFVEACHSRGLTILLDGVFNHVSMHHAWVSGDGPIKRVDGAPVPWEGHGELSELDHRDERTAGFVVDVMRHWLDRGAAGWRLDVAYAVPAEFWRTVLERVRETHPDALFLGEVIHGDYPQIAHDATLDSVTQYELWKAIWSSLADHNFFELAHALERHDEFSQRMVTQTFVGNHDVTRIATKVGDAGAALAAVVLFTVPGMPSIYYGDEQAFRGEKTDTISGDDAVRPPLPATPAEMLPTGDWLEDIHKALIGLRRRHPWLTRGRLHVDNITNTSLDYHVHTGGHHTGEHRLDVHLDLESTPHARLRFNDGETWQGVG